MTIETWDPHAASEDDLRARYDFNAVMEAELDPDTPVEPYESWRKDVMMKSDFHESRRWVARDGDAIVATGYLGLNRTDDNKHLCRGDINVLPSARRQGIGREMLRLILDVAEADGRSVFGTGTPQGHEAEHFLKAAGMEPKLLDRRSRLVLDQIPEGLVEQWLDDVAVKAPGYSLIEIEPVVQAEYRERFIDVLNAMNDAPREGLDRDDEFVTMEQLEDWERQQAERGSKESFLVVMHDETGDFAGYSNIDWDPAHPVVMWQGGTAVKAAHRGHAIGRWLKAANLKKVMEENPEGRFVDTWNAGSNKWMLAINDDLGFRPYIWYQAWQAKIADIKAALR